MAWTTTELVAQIRRDAHLDDNEPDWTATAILAVADEVARRHVLKALLAAREDFLVTYKDFAVTSGQSNYRIPPRALYGNVRDVTYIDSAGRGYNVPQLLLEDIDIYSSATTHPINFAGFTLQGENVVLLPPPNVTTGTLRMRYFRRPGNLVPTTSAYQITGVSVATATITIGTHTFSTGNTVDLIQANPGFDVLNQDLAIASTTGTQLIFSSISNELQVGDWVCVAGSTPIPQLPAEMHNVLGLGTAAHILRSVGDTRADQVDMEFKLALQTALEGLTPRSVGESRYAFNRQSPMRWGWSRWPWRVF